MWWWQALAVTGALLLHSSCICSLDNACTVQSATAACTVPWTYARNERRHDQCGRGSCSHAGMTSISIASSGHSANISAAFASELAAIQCVCEGSVCSSSALSCISVTCKSARWTATLAAARQRRRGPGQTSEAYLVRNGRISGYSSTHRPVVSTVRRCAVRPGASTTCGSRGLACSCSRCRRLHTGRTTWPVTSARPSTSPITALPRSASLLTLRTFLSNPHIRIEVGGLISTAGAPDMHGRRTCSAHRGAAMFALGSKWSRTHHCAIKIDGFEIRPTSVRAFALDVSDTNDPEASPCYTSAGGRPGEAAFNNTSDPAHAAAGLWPSCTEETQCDMPMKKTLQIELPMTRQQGWTVQSVPPPCPAVHPEGDGKTRCDGPQKVVPALHAGIAQQIRKLHYATRSGHKTDDDESQPQQQLGALSTNEVWSEEVVGFVIALLCVGRRNYLRLQPIRKQRLARCRCGWHELGDLIVTLICER